MAETPARSFSRGFVTITPSRSGIRPYKWEIFDGFGRSYAHGEFVGSYDDAAKHACGLLDELKNRNPLEELNDSVTEAQTCQKH